MEKAGEDATEKIKSTDDNKHLMEAKEIEVQEKKAELYSKLETVGNLVHDSVPVSDDEVVYLSLITVVFLFDAMWSNLGIVLEVIAIFVFAGEQCGGSIVG